METKQLLKCFTLHVMDLKYMKVSLFEISYKKKKYLFHHILFFFLDVPVDFGWLFLLVVWTNFTDAELQFVNRTGKQEL